MSLVKDLHPLRHEFESSRSAIPVMWQSPSAIRREDDGRLTRERQMRSWVHRVLKEDLGEKVTEAEWTLWWLAAETEDRARREDGHEVADAPGEDTRRATAWAW